MVEPSLHDKINALLEEVKDPEVPVLSILDLGIVRDVVIAPNQKTKVIITPTYSGCPAMNVIEMEIKMTLAHAGHEVDVETILAPAWTTEWMSEAGKKKLVEYGIAAPKSGLDIQNEFENVTCPQCKSEDTILISEFGSTACKALFKCKTCLEPFDYFKCH